MNSKSKAIDFITYVAAFIVTMYVQDALFRFNLFSLDNLFIDFLSWVIIFLIVYTLLKGLEILIKNLVKKMK